MNKQDQLEELLVDWGLELQQGNELSAEEVCKDNPELVPELSKLISDIKATDWLEEDDDSDDDFIHLPDFSTMSGHADETRLPECSLSVEEFCQRLISSRLMDEEQVGQLRQRITAGDARSFAVQLVSDRKLTRFQATVLLEGRDIPLVLDRYVLLGEIGAGGMGAVYKALHQQMDRVVALKILPKEAVDSPDKVKRFQREMKAAAKLEHGNIVTAFDATESNGTHFLVMSYVNGSDLSQTVRKHGPVSAAKAVSYIAQAASGLEHAHNMGIVHRDIKPGNLLLDKKGKVQILDMGLARIETADAEYDKTVTHELTQAGTVMGTFAYLAPEQALDSRHADGRSDIYSLGCTLYYLLTGKALYIEDTMMKTILAHREAEIPSLCEERESVPAELDAIFQKMVAKQSEDRFQTMTEVISALEELEIEDNEEAQPVVTGSQAYHDTATFIDTSRDVIEPQPGSKSFDPPKRRWPLIASGVFGFIVLLAVITIVTKKGTVTVNIPEQMKDGVQVKIQPKDGGDRAVAVMDKDNNWTVTLSGGEYTVDLQGGQDEFHIEDDNLSVSRFGKSVVEVTFTPAEQIAATDGMAGPDVREITPTVAPPEENWALEFSGKASYVETPVKFDGSHPITIDVRVQPKQESPKGQALISTAHFGGFELKIDEKRKGYCATAFYGPPDKRGGSYRSTGVGSVAYGGWSTLSLILDGDRFDLYLDGVRLPEDSTKFQGGFKPSSLPVYFGGNAEANAPPVWLYQGRLDEIRLSNVARYTEDFKPEKRFESDEHTLALYHFDGGGGDVLKDSSGNGHHGKIVGAKWVRVDDELKVIDGNAGVFNESNVSTLRQALIRITDVTAKAGGIVFLWDTEEQSHKRLRAASDVPLRPTSGPSLKFKDIPNFGKKELTFIAEACHSLPPNCTMSIELSGTELTVAELNVLRGLPIYGLTVNRNQNMNDSISTVILQFENLHILGLQETNVTDATLRSIAEQSHIAELNLRYTKVTPACISSLISLSLEKLNVTGTTFDEEAVMQIQEAMPKCEIVWDGGTIAPEQNFLYQ